MGPAPTPYEIAVATEMAKRHPVTVARAGVAQLGKLADEAYERKRHGRDALLLHSQVCEDRIAGQSARYLRVQTDEELLALDEPLLAKLVAIRRYRALNEWLQDALMGISDMRVDVAWTVLRDIPLSPRAAEILRAGRLEKLRGIEAVELKAESTLVIKPAWLQNPFVDDVSPESLDVFFLESPFADGASITTPLIG